MTPDSSVEILVERLIRGERRRPRRFQVSFSEEAYLCSHWSLLHMLRTALRTEANVRLAVLFGSTAKGDDCQSSDIDVLVVLDDPSIGRVVGLTERLSRCLGRDVQLVGLAEAENLSVLMADIIEQGRVLVDREDRWPALREAATKWRALALREETVIPPPLDDRGFNLDDR